MPSVTELSKSTCLHKIAEKSIGETRSRTLYTVRTKDVKIKHKVTIGEKIILEKDLHRFHLPYKRTGVEGSASQLPTDPKIAIVGKSYFSLDLQA